LARDPASNVLDLRPGDCWRYLIVEIYCLKVVGSWLVVLWSYRRLPGARAEWLALAALYWPSRERSALDRPTCELARFRPVANAEYFRFAPGDAPRLAGATKRVLPMTAERLSFDLLNTDPPTFGGIRRVLAAFTRWRAEARQRAALAQLPTWMLRDIGLSEYDIWREPHLPPWHRY
jgi:uncharacterized protein YjiS (DUF1127 family)